MDVGCKQVETGAGGEGGQQQATGGALGGVKKNKWGQKLCPHDRRPHLCKECDGVSLCEHQRIRQTCKECGGGQLCEHNRRRTYCKECGGGGLCEHQRRRSQCKECRQARTAALGGKVG